MTEICEPPWQPDEQLVPAIMALSSSRPTMRELKPADRSWVVAGLHLKGLTANQIVDRLKPCSLRLVRAVLAEPMTKVCILYQREAGNFGNEYRMMASEVARLSAALAESEAETERVKFKLDRLLDLAITGEGGPTFRCGCPKTRYNTYVDPRTGKTSCREHRRLAVAAYRERARQEHLIGVNQEHGTR